jgi:hypothetical protein
MTHRVRKESVPRPKAKDPAVHVNVVGKAAPTKGRPRGGRYMRFKTSSEMRHAMGLKHASAYKIHALLATAQGS